MTNGVEGLGKVNKDNAIYNAIVDPYWPSICYLKKNRERTI